LKELRYIYAKVKKGMYMNKHEREDVVAYRKIFLERMNELKCKIPTFSGDNLKEVTWPDNPLILVTHDECIFLAYDRSWSF